MDHSLHLLKKDYLKDFANLAPCVFMNNTHSGDQS